MTNQNTLRESDTQRVEKLFVQKLEQFENAWRSDPFSGQIQDLKIEIHLLAGQLGIDSDRLAQMQKTMAGWVAERSQEQPFPCNDAGDKLACELNGVTFATSEMAAPDSSSDPALVFPSEVIDGSGIIEAIANDFESKTKATSDEVNLCVAFSTINGLLTRHIKDDSSFETAANLYSVIIASSGSGKEAPQKYLEEVLTEIRPTVIGSDSITSSTGLLSLLNTQPAVVCIIDEFADDLLTWMGKKTATYQAEIAKILKGVFTKAWKKKFNPRLVKKQLNKDGKDTEDLTSESPHVSIFCCCTRNEFFEAFSDSRKVDGFFGRFTLFELKDGVRKQKIRRRKPVDATLMAGLKGLYMDACEHGPRGSDAFTNPSKDVAVLARTDEAIERLENHYEDIDDKADEESERGDAFRAAVWRRASEKTARFAMMFAVSRHGKVKGCEITLDDANRAIKVSNFLIRRTLILASELMVDSEGEKKCRKVFAQLPARKGSWIARSRVMRNTHFSARDMDQIEKTLVEREDMAIKKEGRKVFYCCTLSKQERDAKLIAGGVV